MNEDQHDLSQYHVSIESYGEGPEDSVVFVDGEWIPAPDQKVPARKKLERQRPSKHAVGHTPPRPERFKRKLKKARQAVMTRIEDEKRLGNG